jgi:hypothetical protein
MGFLLESWDVLRSFAEQTGSQEKGALIYIA